MAKNKGYGDEKRDIGFIAQNVEKVLPEVVHEVNISENESYKTIDYSHITSLLVEGLKEQQEEIDRKNDKIQELENRLNKQEYDIVQLKILICENKDNQNNEICK